MMQNGDRILMEARDHSIRVEQAAAMDLKSNLSRYFAPSHTVDRLVQEYGAFAKTSLNSESGYLLLREAFTESQSLSHSTISRVISEYVPDDQIDYTTSLFDVADPENVAQSAYTNLKKKGYYTFKFKVPEAIVESLKSKILEHLDDASEGSVADMITGDIKAPRQLKTDARFISTCEEMYQIAGDPVIRAGVQKYLGVPPIFNTPVAFLNSFQEVKSERELSSTAQLFHHDLHRLKFVKVFVYLTDVSTGTGPHVMIPGTHTERPHELWKDGRHTDDSVDRLGFLDQQVEITGAAGTVFLVDTSALHKGAAPKTGHRLMAQVQYTNSLFGRPLAKSDRKVELAQTSKNASVIAAAELVRKFSDFAGVRFMQNLI